MDNEVKNRIYSLRNELNYHNRLYYINNSPSISDIEYDRMMHELLELENQYPEYYDQYSPTQRVGNDHNEGFAQVTHERPMLSLSNTYSIDEVADFIKRAYKELGDSEEVKIVGELKYDGTSISLQYENGRLVRAVTRGDGVRGDDVTRNVMTIKSIPLVLPKGNYPYKFEVRGEILMPWTSFEELNKERAYNEEPLFANPRNAAAGSIKMQNSQEVAHRKLDAYIYYFLGDNLPYDNHYDNLKAIKEWGFKVSPHISLLNTVEEVREFINVWDIKRKELPVATDGLVFKINSLRQQEILGNTSKSPRWGVAYKFQAERAETRLKYVSFETGRMGVITPVANLEPVLLSGTIVKRASLHNDDIIKSLDIHEGDSLYVEKGGEIIPKIVGVNKTLRIKGSMPVQFVTHCQECGTELERIEGEAAWTCPNKNYCPPQIKGKIEHFVGRKMMNIDGIGEELVDRLYSVEMVRNVADLYDLTMERLLTLDRLKEKSAMRILKGIEESKQVSYRRVVYALSIPNVGETMAKILANASVNIDRLMSMTVEELSSINEIGPIIAKNVVEFFEQASNIAIIERLRIAGVKLALDESEQISKTDVLSGKTIVISGVFKNHSREEYKAMIENNGGKNSGSISAKTAFILAGENMGPSKLEKAKQLSVPIINEEEFIAMLEKVTS
ncbi:MAG: NAD-dependent DNA ligase LigA [Muribaculaceae bacterium]|nr:NAD-dependent DNA ligase LigA [Muribaculaceae bacterium]